MRIIVTGGRDYNNKLMVYHILSSLQANVIGVGDCPTGSDKFVRDWVNKQEFGMTPQLTVYKADWEKYDKSAGPIRNSEMIREESPWFCLAFPGGKGTNDCISQCKKRGIPVLRVEDFEIKE